MKTLFIKMTAIALLALTLVLTGCGSSLELEDCCNDSNTSSVVADATVTPDKNATMVPATDTNTTVPDDANATDDCNCTECNTTTPAPEPACVQNVLIDNFGSYQDETLETDLGVVSDNNITLHLDVQNLSDCSVIDMHAEGNITDANGDIVATINRHLIDEFDDYHIENWEINTSGLPAGNYTISIMITGNGSTISEAACITFVIEESCESTCTDGDEIEVIIDDFEEISTTTEDVELFLAIQNVSDCDAHYVHAVGRIIDGDGDVVSTFNRHLVNDLYGGDYHEEDFQIDVADLAPGEYTVFVEVRDDEGEGDVISVAEACVTFTISDDC